MASKKADYKVADETALMRRLICAFVVTNHQRQFSLWQSNCYMSFYHERLESKIRNLIFVKYDIINRTELLFEESL